MRPKIDLAANHAGPRETWRGEHAKTPPRSSRPATGLTTPAPDCQSCAAVAQQPPDDQPPSWLATPTDYQAPAAPTAYQADWAPESEKLKPPESFVPIRPRVAPHAAPMAPNDGGFGITIGGYTFTGWHGIVLSGLVLGFWTGLTLYSDVSTNAASQAFWAAPRCNGAITDSCRADYLANITYDWVSSSNCVVHTQGGPAQFDGEFPAEACRGLGVIDEVARVMIWQGQIVFLERRDIGHIDQQFWSKDSVVGRHGQASSDIVLPLFIDLVYVIALVLALIYRFVNPFKRR